MLYLNAGGVNAANHAFSALLKAAIDRYNSIHQSDLSRLESFRFRFRYFRENPGKERIRMYMYIKRPRVTLLSID